MKIKTSSDGRSYLNLGCGSHFFEDWNNLDLLVHPSVICFDVTQVLPFADNSFDVAYSSHVLEHLEPEKGRGFLAEQFRVLKPGGICRVAVPDLERICRDYLAQLEAVTREPRPENELNYDWSIYQLFDQMVRQKSGGEMLKALDRGAYDEAWVRSRFGEGLLPPQGGSPAAHVVSRKLPGLRNKWRRFLRRQTGRTMTAHEQGEVHRWMYDRHSLPRLLAGLGFIKIEVTTHLQSAIPGWETRNLDISSDGSAPRKPDSLFVEARKP